MGPIIDDLIPYDIDGNWVLRKANKAAHELAYYAKISDFIESLVLDNFQYFE